MRPLLLLAAFLIGTGVSQAGGLDLQVLLSGEVLPGVYGQVNIGNQPAPPVVYAQPMLIEPQPVALAPIYLHVPPDHARNWRKHCHEYGACNRPVYFVRSQEYDPEYQRHYEDHAQEREQERQRWQERDSHRGRDGERGEGRPHDEGEHGHRHDRNDE